MAANVKEPPSGWRIGKSRMVIELAIQAAEVYGIHPAAVFAGYQYREHVKARAYVAHYLREKGWSTTMIGRSLGGMHASSITHLLRRYPMTEDIPKPAAPESFKPTAAFRPTPLPEGPDLSGEWAI